MAREQLKADDETETSLLDRRSYMKLAGSAAAAVAAGSGSATAAEPVGFGEGGYGQMAFGGGAAESAPTVERFDVSKSEQLGDDRMFSVKWAVADADADLDVVEVVVHQGTADVNFSVSDVSGTNDSGWDLFQFPVDSTLDVTLRAKDEGNRVVKQSKTITL